MKAKEITKALRRQFKQVPLRVENMHYRNMWEADFIYVTTAGWVHEIEVKVYRHDFVRDLQDKRDKYMKLFYNASGLKKFFYACPAGMLEPAEIPNFAGLIYCEYGRTWIHKKATVLKDAWKCDRALTEQIKKQKSRNYIRKFEGRVL